jgi:hypothetical protein
MDQDTLWAREEAKQATFSLPCNVLTVPKQYSSSNACGLHTATNFAFVISEIVRGNIPTHKGGCACV